MPEPLLGYGLNRKVVLEHHLTHNHYPPVDLRWVPIAEAAIDLAVSKCEVNDDGNAYCDVPELDDQVGQGKTAREVLDGLHLWDFVTATIFGAQLLGEEYVDEPKAHTFRYARSNAWRVMGSTREFMDCHFACGQLGRHTGTEGCLLALEPAPVNAMQEHRISVLQVLEEAAGLLGPVDDEQSVNPEYTRAIVELVTRLIPGYNHDDHDEVLALIRKAGA